MKKVGSFLKRSNGGELIYSDLGSYVREKYKPDTPLDWGAVPYIVMAFCGAVDASVFISLFRLISYDSLWMIVVEVAGFLWAFDVVPLYAGIHLRRLKQGLTQDAFLLWLAAFVFTAACIANIILRILTIKVLFPDAAAAESFLGTVTEELQHTVTDPSAIALTIFGIVLPVLTSVGSFFVSYLTYNPLKTQRRRMEELLAEKDDEIRRLDAILSEYDADSNFARRMMDDDEGNFNEMKKTHRAMVANYCDYVRLSLKEHLSNPAANNALSEENCVAILDRLDRELAALDKSYSGLSEPCGGGIDEAETGKTAAHVAGNGKIDSGQTEHPYHETEVADRNAVDSSGNMRMIPDTVVA